MNSSAYPNSTDFPDSPSSFRKKQASSSRRKMRLTSVLHQAESLQTLHKIASANLARFQRKANSSFMDNARFFRCFQQLQDHSVYLLPIVEKMKDKVHKFDYEKVEANGFRSLLGVVDACLQRLIITSQIIDAEGQSLLFRTKYHLNHLEEYTRVLGGLRKMLDYAHMMMEQMEHTGSVFPKEGSTLLETWYEEVETLDQEIFYANSMAFQYHLSIRRAMQTIALALAVCADTFMRHESRQKGSAQLARNLPSLLSTTRFYMRAHLRAKQIVQTTRNADINFCKQFWNLTEANYLQSGMTWILPSVAVNQTMEIPAEILQVHGWPDGKEINLKPPVSLPNGQGKPVSVRYISDVNYHELSADGTKPALSPYLVFHCHGGGFIAQSSKAHEVYLLKWAKDLKVPILSVDYALAPEYPYPKGLDEVVFAYAWAQKNAGLLGWTGEKVCFVGDSAGANLVVGAAIKSVCKGLKAPDGIVAAYGAFLVQYTPSPSRMLCLMDPLLPVGILMRCLAAYADLQEPTHVGQIQGANIKEAADEGSSASDSPGASQSASRQDSSNSGTDSVFSDGTSDVVNGETQSSSASPSPTSPKQSFWFGKGIAKLFDGIRTRSKSNEEESASKLDKDVAADLASGTKRVPPLPRYNFASVSVADPFLSPLLASDELLKMLPSIYLVACHFDPLLDDSISLAKRLSILKPPGQVHLDVLEGLPHGFLNFRHLSAEADEASDLCAQRIRQALKM